MTRAEGPDLCPGCDAVGRAVLAETRCEECGEMFCPDCVHAHECQEVLQ